MNPQTLSSKTDLFQTHSLPCPSFCFSAKPFNEAIRLSGRSYQDCHKVYLSESTDALLLLSCTASSKPGSRLTWTTDPATPALVNQSIAAECKTAADGIVTCESNATIVTKALEDSVQVTCVTHFDDNQTVVTSKRPCVVLVPHGTFGHPHVFVRSFYFELCGTIYGIYNIFVNGFSLLFCHISLYGCQV